MPFRHQKHCLQAVFLIGLAFALCAADSPGPQFIQENTESVAADDADIDALSESLSGPDDVTFDVDTKQKKTAGALDQSLGIRQIRGYKGRGFQASRQCPCQLERFWLQNEAAKQPESFCP